MEIKVDIDIVSRNHANHTLLPPGASRFEADGVLVIEPGGAGANFYALRKRSSPNVRLTASLREASAST